MGTYLRRVTSFVLLFAAVVWMGFSPQVWAKAESTQPTHSATSSYYTQLYRDQFHYSPSSGDLADPNGLVYFHGVYNMYYQEDGTWAHAISTDLVHWKHLPLAIPQNNLGQILSGSVVVDSHDTSGFFKNGSPGLVAIFTQAQGNEQYQSIAYSNDNGVKWTMYKGNPVIPNTGQTDFRDPKVFWYPRTHEWIMVVSTNQTVTFYGSPNLKHWKYLSTFGAGQGAHYAVWEDPDLFQLPVDGNRKDMKWVLHVSVGDNNVTNGSTDQYFIGNFNGTTFTNDNPPNQVLSTDSGRDFYAAQTFSNVPGGNKIWIGWMSNWRYPYQSPTSTWEGTMSLPRELFLRTISGQGIRLVQKPISNLKMLRMPGIHLKNLEVRGTKILKGFQGTDFEFDAQVTWGQLSSFGIEVRKSSISNQKTDIGFNAASNSVFVNRENSGLKWITDRNGNQFRFGEEFSTPYFSHSHTIKIQGFVDQSSVEIFINGGQIVFTNLIYPNPTSNGVALFSRGGPADFKSLTIFPLKSIWRKTPAPGEPTRIIVSQHDVRVSQGQRVRLAAIVKPDWLSNKRELTWKVKNTSIARVTSSNGQEANIEGITPGSTSVEVSYPRTNLHEAIAVTVSPVKRVRHGGKPGSTVSLQSGQISNVESLDITTKNGVDAKGTRYTEYDITLVGKNGQPISTYNTPLGGYNRDMEAIDNSHGDLIYGWLGGKTPNSFNPNGVGPLGAAPAYAYSGLQHGECAFVVETKKRLTKPVTITFTEHALHLTSKVIFQ